jgi:hypothetical protein
MKQLISREEKRQELEQAFDAGYEWGRIVALEGSWDCPDFDEWYEQVYGGPDCD